ncbi:coiled-coil domain-containing protein 86 [Condylostylus longicornis]|uniref:coiled-coil domain-containing protein 86 n=1 Tax=Condylostylus longicornis TaxID=2530218 RepID=UPI00244DF185|nr:coiled-coil domain-containing protein 86 [Condylostylus longicornis]
MTEENKDVDSLDKDNKSNGNNEPVSNNNTASNITKPEKPPASKKTKLKKIEQIIPRGKPKSGRPWKEPRTKFSTIKKSIYRRPFHKKVELRNEIQHIKQISKSIKDAKKEEKEIRKQRRLENAERRLANQRKSEVVQIIKNPNKIKRMKKKHLRMIEKRDLDNVKVV